jgi:hypothetical protein
MTNLNSTSAISLHQYLVIDRPTCEVLAVLTIQDNLPVGTGEINSLNLQKDTVKPEGMCDYFDELRIYEPEFYGEIAQAIASEMIDITQIQIKSHASFMIPYCPETITYPENSPYDKVFDCESFQYLFTLTPVQQD